jgi:hydroxymethylpyrimidine/phosphomethylpyrimidine kinase
MRSVLTIAGSDSSGNAGIQADLRTFEALGVRGATAITAITAQNSRGVIAIQPVEADLVTAQIEAVTSDIELHATKIGMLATAAVAEAVAAAIEELDLPLVVLDPVLASTSGTRLLDDDGVQALVAELLPKALVVTPNIPEAEMLTGIRILTLQDAQAAARRLHDMGAGHVVVKGGHGTQGLGLRAEGLEQGGGLRREGSGLRREGSELRREGSEHRAERRVEEDDVVDLLFDGRQFHELRVARVHGRNVRGTGCSYASALAAFLALGSSLPDAAARAQRHVAALIARTYTER